MTSRNEAAKELTERLEAARQALADERSAINRMTDLTTEILQTRTWNGGDGIRWRQGSDWNCAIRSSTAAYPTPGVGCPPSCSISRS